MKGASVFILIAAAILLAACSSTGASVSVVDAWARPAEAGSNSAAYFQLFNNSDAADALLSAEATVARAVEIHETMAVEIDDEMDGMVDSANENGMEMEAMVMVPQERVDLAAGETVIFQPGGLHVMMIDLNQALAVGDMFDLTLNFESGLIIQLEVEVKQP